MASCDLLLLSSEGCRLRVLLPRSQPCRAEPRASAGRAMGNGEIGDKQGKMLGNFITSSRVPSGDWKYLRVGFSCPWNLRLSLGGDMSFQIHSVRVPLRQLCCLLLKEVAHTPEMLKPCFQCQCCRYSVLPKCPCGGWSVQNTRAACAEDTCWRRRGFVTCVAGN